MAAGVWRSIRWSHSHSRRSFLIVVSSLLDEVYLRVAASMNAVNPGAIFRRTPRAGVMGSATSAPR